MAKMKRNIGDMVSGKIGNVVFVQMKNKSYVRSAPVRKKNNWTELQILYRRRLQTVSALWRSIQSDLMKQIWNHASNEMNGFAWFVKKNIGTLSIDGEITNPLLLTASDGKLYPLQFLKAEQEDPLSDVIKVSWQNDPNLKASRLNDALFAITLVGDHFSEVNYLQLKRGDLNGTFHLPLPNHPYVDGKKTLFLFMGSEAGVFSKSESFAVG